MASIFHNDIRVKEIKKLVHLRAFDQAHTIPFVDRDIKYINFYIELICPTAFITSVETYYDGELVNTEVKVKPLQINSPYTNLNQQ
jgi:hypothetical protein